MHCEAGVSLADLLVTVVGRPAPDGGVWFLPVTPGTRFVTVGGAIANDVHGKNHETAGSFGHHLIDLLLLRSDGTIVRCAHDENADLFRATIGGLGLTGLILEARLQLVSVPSLWLENEDLRFEDLEGFFGSRRTRGVGPTRLPGSTVLPAAAAWGAAFSAAPATSTTAGRLRPPRARRASPFLSTRRFRP